MSIELFYSCDYIYHKGFNSSLENSTRISYVIDNISTSISITKKDTKTDLSKYWQDLIVSFKNKFDKFDKINCNICTFENKVESKRCIMCESEIHNKVKIISNIDGDTTYMCDTSENCISSLLKSIIYMLDFQISTKKHSFLLSRPPGHHSDNITPQGFCIINNIAFAADHLRKFYDKILILDWDVHHGNGTQKIFYNRDDVFFIDIHRENFYPFSGNKEEIGEGKGEKYTLNVPMKVGSDEKDYIKIFDELIIPRILEFKPEWILISCGFDAHYLDPIGGMKLQSSSYRCFHDKLVKLDIPLTYLLEGGYDNTAIKESIIEMIR